ncbi:hypothetical protein TNCV_5067401 [Trichonephila clavipes]|nr:hypothetical protein TNCV_5067401 [Trichonephila clavipes]
MVCKVVYVQEKQLYRTMASPETKLAQSARKSRMGRKKKNERRGEPAPPSGRTRFVEIRPRSEESPIRRW